MKSATADTGAAAGPLKGVAWIAIVAQAVVFGAPLMLVVWLSLQGTVSAPAGFSLTAWTSLAGSPEARMAILSTLLLSAITAISATFLGLPLAYFIALRGRFLGRLALAFVIIMWFLDPGIRILGWMRAYKDLALYEFDPGAVLGGFSAELIAGIHAWLPLAVLILALGFARTDKAVIAAARECGASSHSILRHILWPLNRRVAAISTAALFSGSIGSFLEPRLLGTGQFEQASEWLQRALESETGWPYAAAMLLVMLALAALPLFLVFAAAARRRRGAA